MGKLGLYIKEVNEKTTQNNQYEVLTSSQGGIVSQEDYFNKQVASTDNTGYKVIRKGQFTYRSMSDTGRFYINRLTNREVGIVSPAYPVFEILSDRITSDYLSLFFQSEHFQSQISDKASGSTRLALRYSKLENVEINIIAKEKQEKIVRNIDLIKKVIEAEEREQSILDELIKSRFIEMFGNPMDEMKWNSTFTEVVIFNPKKSEVKKDMEIEASFVPMEAIGTDGSFSIRKSGKIKDFYKGYTYFKDGDVIFAKITPCFENGKIAIANHCANKIGFGTTEFHVARPIPGKTNAEWIMNLLRNDSLHTYASSKMTGSAGQKRIQTPFFEKLGVYLPPLELQNSFAEFVKLIDKSKFNVQQRIEKYKELLDKKMSEYFN